MQIQVELQQLQIGQGQIRNLSIQEIHKDLLHQVKTPSNENQIFRLEVLSKMQELAPKDQI